MASHDQSLKSLFIFISILVIPVIATLNMSLGPISLILFHRRTYHPCSAHHPTDLGHELGLFVAKQAL